MLLYQFDVGRNRLVTLYFNAEILKTNIVTMILSFIFYVQWSRHATRINSDFLLGVLF